MKLLIKDNIICAIAENISYGRYENEDKWRLADSEDNLMYYMIDSDFTLVENVEVPSDYVDGKYFFENGEFVLNEDWKPYVSPEQRLEILEEENIKLSNAIDNIWNDIAASIETGVNEV